MKYENDWRPWKWDIRSCLLKSRVVNIQMGLGGGLRSATDLLKARLIGAKVLWEVMSNCIDMKPVIVMDEADLFIPPSTETEYSSIAEVVYQLVLKGLRSGIALIFITQNPANMLGIASRDTTHMMRYSGEGKRRGVFEFARRSYFETGKGEVAVFESFDSGAET